ncbi:helix-turn-helix domain-containing protein [Pandoraea cepalis]|nr:helix-turn-helix domain-containing protein [Pandoraea cepalis]
MSTARTLVAGTASLLHNWPGSFYTLLASLQQSSASSSSVRRAFGVLYHVLYDDLKPPCFQFLRNAFEDYLSEHWWGMVCKRNRLLRRETVASHPRITLQQAATAAGVDRAVIRHLAQAELIPIDQAIYTSGRRASTMHQRDLVGLVTLVEGAVTLKTASHLSQISERRLRELISDGIIKPLVSRHSQRTAAWLIPKVELDRLRIVPNAPDIAAGIILLDVFKYWRLREHESTQLVRAILDREISTHAPHKAAVPLGLAKLDRVTVKLWLASQRDAAEAAMSVDQAAKLLGVKQQVAYSLIHGGYLHSCYDAGLGHRVSMEQVESFKQEYVSLAELARQYSRSPRALLSELPAKPACGPTVDGCRQYFYRRADLAPRKRLSRTSERSYPEKRH